MRWHVGVVAMLLAGCTAPVDDLALDAEDVEGRTLELGTGWGQMRFPSAQNGTVITIENPAFEDFGFAADHAFDGERVYVPGAYTVVHAQTGDTSQVFWWLGADVGFSGPEGTSPDARAGQLLVPALQGDEVVLTVATNVPGYKIDIDGGGAAKEWTLTEHPDLIADVPDPEDELGTDTGPARVFHERTWRVEMPARAPSFTAATAWTSDFEDLGVQGARAGVAEMAFHLGPAGEPPQEVGPVPSFGSGAYFGGQWTGTHANAEPEDLEASFWFRATDAGNTRTSEGMTVVSVPLAP